MLLSQSWCTTALQGLRITCSVSEKNSFTNCFISRFLRIDVSIEINSCIVFKNISFFDRLADQSGPLGKNPSGTQSIMPDLAVTHILVAGHPHGGPVGLKTIAASTSEEVETIEDIYEPYLLQIGFLARSMKGRIATKEAYAHLGIPFEASQTQETLL